MARPVFLFVAAVELPLRRPGLLEDSTTMFQSATNRSKPQRALWRLLAFLLTVVGMISVTAGSASAVTTTTPNSSSGRTASVGPETRVGVTTHISATSSARIATVSPACVEENGTGYDGTTVASCVATKTLATGTDEAVFWSGVGPGGDSTAAAWAAKNGGATLESTMAARGVKLPVWDGNNPASVAAWRQASADFASGASGNVRVLQGTSTRVDSVWASVEFPALKANPNVRSITAVNPTTGQQVVLWTR